jgi:polysaccharide pyruvyl transferase CsaB
MVGMLSRILVAGYYGFGNTGDEAILAGMLAEMRRLNEDLDFVVISGDPQSTAALHHVRSIHWKDLDQIAAASKECDLFLLGGGGLFHDYWGVNPDDMLTENSYGISYYSGIPYLAALNNKPCVLYSAGVGPLLTDEGKEMTRSTADLCELITVRDIQSKEWLVSLGIQPDRIHVGSDPAFNLPIDHSFGKEYFAKLESKIGQLVIGVSIRPWEISISNQAWQQVVAEALDEIIRDLDATLLFLPFQRDETNDPLIDDYAASLALIEMMDQKDKVLILSDHVTPSQLAGVISQCDLLVGMRLHSLIFATMAGVAFVAIAYDPKIQQFVKELEVSAYAVPIGGMNKALLSSLIDRAWQNRLEIKTKLSNFFKKQAAAQQDTARKALALLDRPEKSNSIVLDIENLKAFGLRQTLRLGEKLSTIKNLNEQNRSLQREKLVLQEEKFVLQEEKFALQEEKAALQDGIQYLQGEIHVLNGQINRIKKSRSYRFARKIMGLRVMVLPIGSRREYYVRNIWRDLSGSRREGLLSIVKKWSRWFMRKNLSGTMEPVSLNGQLPYSRSRSYAKYSLLPQIQASEIAEAISALPDTTKPVRPDVVCFSIIKWEFRYQRPQQMMSQFAENGHRVFYINIADFLPAGSKQKYKLRKIKDNVYEITLSALRAPDVYGEVIEGENLESVLDSLDELRNKLFLNDTIGYVMIASWGAVALEAQNRWGWRIIYDCMDEWDTFPLIKQPLIQMEKELVRCADLLVVTAKKLYDKWHSYGTPIVLSRNGVDFDFFQKNLGENDLLKDLKGPVIGYYGAIADWFDLALVHYVAEQRPQYQFVFLGGIFDVDVSQLQLLPNVHLLGQQPYELMPKYLFDFDVCMIPFKINAVTQATDPVKLYEYLSAGKPVVSVDLSEISIYRDLIYTATSKENFLFNLDQAVNEDDPEIQAKRIELAKNNTWGNRYEIVNNGLKAVTPKASIIIVTYNNLLLNKICLESVYANTDYPNYEVIVVDNNSVDGTPAFLREFKQKQPDIKLILNETNYGFAKANNQGLAAAEGEYLVLLNNDTVVPPGWLTRLVKHLQDHTIGLVGPATNFAGNEARIPVLYNSWEEMEVFANEQTWQNDNQIADIHVLAMFCIAFRKCTFDEIGELDEEFGIGMFEDDDYAQRVRKNGYRTICALDAFVHHVGQASFKKLIRAGSYDPLFEKNKARYEAKWQTKWLPHKHGKLQSEAHVILYKKPAAEK